MDKRIFDYLRLGIGGDIQTILAPTGGSGGPISGTTITASVGFLAPPGTAATPGYAFTGFTTTGLYVGATNNRLGLTTAGVATLALDSTHVVAPSGSGYYFSATADPDAAVEFGLVRDAANVLAQKNGANAQEFRAYGTTTGPKYITLKHDGTFGYVGPNNGNLVIVAAGTNVLTIAASSITLTSGNGTVQLGSSNVGFSKLFLDYTNTATVGNVTINKVGGKVNLAALGTSLTLTNSTITVASRLILQLASSPGNAVAVMLSYVPSAGSAIITATPAVTNQTIIDFTVINAD